MGEAGADYKKELLRQRRERKAAGVVPEGPPDGAESQHGSKRTQKGNDAKE